MKRASAAAARVDVRAPPSSPGGGGPRHRSNRHGNDDGTASGADCSSPESSKTRKLPSRLRSPAVVAPSLLMIVACAAVWTRVGSDRGLNEEDRNTNGAKRGTAAGVAESKARQLPGAAGGVRRERESKKIQGAAAVADDGPCGIERLDLSGDRAAVMDKPAIFTSGWKGPAQPSWSRDNFLASYGHYAQYVKGPDVQPLADSGGDKCVATGSEMAKLLNGSTTVAGGGGRLLFFTNDRENEPFLSALGGDYSVPPHLGHVSDFRVFSAMDAGGSHPFHRHGEAWIGAASGAKAWWILPPDAPRPAKVSGCDYLGAAKPPKGTLACVQRPGEVVHLPHMWWHATCALEDWTVGVGAQVGDLSAYEQDFASLGGYNDDPRPAWFADDAAFRKKMAECGVATTATTAGGGSGGGGDGAPPPAAAAAAAEPSGAVARAVASGWKFFDGDLNEYYNKLHRDEKRKRDPKDVKSFAVHRWLGPGYSTETQYREIRDAVRKLHASPDSPAFRVFDAGCGLGAGLAWFEKNEPSWHLLGHTISEEQHDFIEKELPPHRFDVALKSYDEPDGTFDAIYSIEAFVHSPDGAKTIKAWSDALRPGGVIAIVDDVLAGGVDRTEEEVELFAKSWLANTLFTVAELADVVKAAAGLDLVLDRDLGKKYHVVELNYGKKMPEIAIDGNRTHQGWMGSKLRQRLTVAGKLTYRLLVFQKVAEKKDGTGGGSEHRALNDCPAVPTATEGGRALAVEPIQAQLRTGRGDNAEMKCISGWYCCGKGGEWWDDLEKSRTDSTGFLRLPRDLFGHYLDAFVKHLNEFYGTLPADFAGGKFLDIGGMGSTASGMPQVTSKFAHWAGPLEYWVLDSDPEAAGLPRSLSCDMAACPEAPSCGFDVTFSHTVLEHTPRPWAAFDEIARVTRRGGLTMHLVPFSYQYHATPDDHFRFSHRALASLLEDRGFTVLEVGYDICNKPPEMLRRRDEHYDVIWLTYVIARKN